MKCTLYSNSSFWEIKKGGKSEILKQWNKTSRYFKLKEYPFLEKILPNISHECKQELQL